MKAALAQGFWLGLATGPYCFAACAPLLLPLLAAEGETSLAANAASLARFLAGRLLAYLAFGAAAGAVGAALGPALPPWLTGAALGLTAALMLGYAVMKNFPRLGLCLAAGRWVTPSRVPFWLGLLTGLNVCPPFLAGLVLTMAGGSILRGASFFAAFFAATSLYLLPVLGVWPWLSSAWARAAGRATLFLAGLWSLVQAAELLWMSGP